MPPPPESIRTGRRERSGFPKIMKRVACIVAAAWVSSCVVQTEGFEGPPGPPGSDGKPGVLDDATLADLKEEIALCTTNSTR